MSEQRFAAPEAGWYRLVSGAEPEFLGTEPPSGRASNILALGHTLAERYQRDNGTSHQLAFLAAPTIHQEAMQEAANEQDYYAKCHALDLPSDDAKQILADMVAVADRSGLPMAEVWARAWQQAIDKSSDSPVA